MPKLTGWKEADTSGDGGVSGFNYRLFDDNRLLVTLTCTGNKGAMAMTDYPLAITQAREFEPVCVGVLRRIEGRMWSEDADQLIEEMGSDAPDEAFFPTLDDALHFIATVFQGQ